MILRVFLQLFTEDNIRIARHDHSKLCVVLLMPLEQFYSRKHHKNNFLCRGDLDLCVQRALIAGLSFLILVYNDVLPFKNGSKGKILKYF